MRRPTNWPRTWDGISQANRSWPGRSIRRNRAVKWARRHRITAVLWAAGLVTAMILGAVAIHSEIATRWEAAHFRLNARNTISHSDDLRANGQLDNARDLLVRLLAQLSGRPRLSEWHDVAAYKLDQISTVSARSGRLLKTPTSGSPHSAGCATRH